MKKFLWPVRVYYEDTDSGGVVYHANYLKYFERARTEYLRSLGHQLDVLLQNEGVLFVVKSMQIDYLKPARFNDALQVELEITALKSASLIFLQTLMRESDEILSVAEVRVVCLRADGFRPVAIPEFLLQSLKNDL